MTLFQVGDRVQHDAIGEGTVTEIYGDDIVRVVFDRATINGEPFIGDYDRKWFAQYPDALRPVYAEHGWI